MREVIAFLFLWIVAAVWLLISEMGNKHGKSPWWHWVVGAPIIVIAPIFGYFAKRERDKWKKKYVASRNTP